MTQMKVFGWTGHKTGLPSSQARFIVAAPSIAAVLRLTGMSRYEFNLTGCETGNEIEIALATGSPGVVYFQGVHAGAESPWSVDGDPA